MFKKLLKYDLKEVGMVLLPMYLALVAIGTAAGFAMRYSVVRGAGEMVASAVPGVVTLILFLVFGIMGLATGLVTLVMIMKNFRDNLLGSRGYLMNTLPVTTAQQVLSKTLNGTLYIIFGGTAGGISGLIILLIVLRKPDWEALAESFRYSFGTRISPTEVLIQVLILLLLWAVQVVAKMYLSLALGNLFRSHRNLGAILIFVFLTIGQSLLGNLMEHITADASIGYSIMQSMMRLVFLSGEPSGLFTMRQFLLTGGQDVLYIVVFVALTVRILKTKLDLQ